MRHFIPFLLLFVFAFADAQHIDARKIDAYLDNLEAYDQGVGSISVFKHGEEVYRRDFGQSANPNLKVDASTKYQVGSITKVFTAAMIWKLIEAKKLSLDTKLSEFYPKFPKSDKITIKQMLEHTSGLKDYILKNDSVKWLSVKVPKQEILAEIEKQGLKFEPGTGVKYSNSAFYLLKEIVEKKYHSTFGKIIQKHIISPNKLGDLAAADTNPTNISEPYNYRNKVWTKMVDYDYANSIGVGDISATPAQLNRFMHQLFHGKIVKKASLAKMIPGENEEWGRNLMPIPFRGRMFYGHAGDASGWHTIALYDKQNDINVAICINGHRLEHNELYVGILDAIYSENQVLPFFVKTDDLEKYVGKFQSNDRALQLEFYMQKSGDLMCLDVLAEVAFPMTPSATNKFYFKPLGINLEFNQNLIFFEQNGIKLMLQKVV
ncbi:serine hydrolase [Flavobacterium sp.]|uniref:serine hydrolase domain-containing protein n=1 Tax=Flavobacterium sp. TaxID=239 RepID=UPI0011FC0DEA|nr:serine hydrolase domain-containing protein [Flavobacterium sp.]RZJ69375.1 MAG: class A beta-lactamase-related serine hydrolase [Flavobacterium sp.]